MRPKSEHSKADIEFHAVQAAFYDEEVTSEYRIYDDLALVPFLDRLAAGGSVLSALDLGCGTGEVAMHLATRGFIVEAVDHSAEMIGVARAKALRQGVVERIAFQVGEIGDLPFEGDRFDVVTCQRVLHHIPDVGPVFAEVERVLKPGGWFYLSDGVADRTAAARALRSLWRLVHTRGRRAAVRKDIHEPPPGHEVVRPAAELKRLLDAAGFSYELRFFTHVDLRRHLSSRQRTLLVKALSLPRTKGDVLFAYARKPPLPTVPHPPHRPAA